MNLILPLLIMWIWLLCATLRYIFGIGVCINDDQQLPRHPGHGDFHLRALSRQAAAENPRAKVHTYSIRYSRYSTRCLF